MVGSGGPAAMIRVLLEPGDLTTGRRVSLLEGEAHHLRVRRANDDEPVEVRDGRGLVGKGRLLRSGKSWDVELLAVERAGRAPNLTLVVGAGDRDRFAWMVEKATELGVTAVIPLESERTVGVASRLRPQHLERMRRHALEAVKQSGAAWATELRDPVSWASIIGTPPAGKGWVADIAGSPVPAVLGEHELTIVIGPEGGLTQAELERLRSVGYRPVGLGPHTLRFETAAIAAAAGAIAARARGNDG